MSLYTSLHMLWTITAVAQESIPPLNLYEIVQQVFHIREYSSVHLRKEETGCLNISTNHTSERTVIPCFERRR